VNGALIRKHVDAYVTTTSVEAARTAAVQGLGLAQLTYWDVFRQLADKSLEQIHLEDATMEDLSVWAVMPSRRYVPNRVSVFLDALRNQIAELGRSLGRAPS
jgi:DNA-binding transcriptional LysR family regulator